MPIPTGYRRYGGSTADFTYDVGTVSAVSVLVPGGSVGMAVWDDPTPSSGAQVTTGLLSTAGAPITTVTSDADGDFVFDGVLSLPPELYVSALGSGGTPDAAAKRYRVSGSLADLDARVDVLEAGGVGGGGADQAAIDAALVAAQDYTDEAVSSRIQSTTIPMMEALLSLPAPSSMPSGSIVFVKPA